MWRDANGNGKVEAGETMSLAGAGIASLGLAGTAVDGTYQFGEVAILNTGTYTRADGTTRGFADAALTYFSAAWSPTGAPGQGQGEGQGQPGVFPRLSRRQQILDDLAGGRILDDLVPSAPRRPQVMPYERIAFADLEQAAPAAAPDADLARKLALLRQDLGAFGAARGEGLDKRLMAEPGAFDWYA